jgi:hypothetical protein
METWLPLFVIVASIAIVVQAAVMTGMYLAVRRSMREIDRGFNELRTHVIPILGRVQALVDQVHPQVTGMVADAAHITRLARTQVQHADRVASEALDRIRMQLLHADQILTGALEAVDGAGSTIRRAILGPVQSVSALVHGIQTGLDVFRGNRRHGLGPEGRAETQDESLFI